MPPFWLRAHTSRLEGWQGSANFASTSIPRSRKWKQEEVQTSIPTAKKRCSNHFNGVASRTCLLSRSQFGKVRDWRWHVLTSGSGKPLSGTVGSGLAGSTSKKGRRFAILMWGCPSPRTKVMPNPNLCSWVMTSSYLNVWSTSGPWFSGEN